MRFANFVNPKTGSPLMLSNDGQAFESDGERFPIIEKIPRFVGGDNYAAGFGWQWNKFQKTQLDSYIGIPISRERLIRCLRGNFEELHGKRVLEAGSGAGRFTEIIIEKVAELDSFDYSLAVEANARNNFADNVGLSLAQADIRHMPYQNNSYDFVICLGVLQHTPDPEESIRCLWQKLKPGGTLVIDHYPSHWKLKMPWPINEIRPIFRLATLKLPEKFRFPFIKFIVDLLFPVHWGLRNMKFAQKILRRISPVVFYYNVIPLRDRNMHYEWSLLDTHDASTDYFHHLRTVEQIKTCLESLDAIDIEVTRGGNGIEATARKKPTSI